jgi:NTE family protein
MSLAKPDALVLGAGGTLGIHWLRGLLAGLEAETGWDLRRCDYFVGTSAGSVVAAGLAGGQRPDAGKAAAAAWSQAAPADAFESATGAAREGRLGPAAKRIASAAATPFAPLALAASAPGGAAARAAVLAASPRGERRIAGLGPALDQIGAKFDGRLRVATVDRKRGRRVIFGEPGSPPATVSEAVLASCAIPWVFSPVEIDGREYVDGGVWSLTNLDAVPARRGAEVLCLVPTASAFAALRAATHAALLAELLAVRARGARVKVVTPDAASAKAIGVNLMNARRTSQVVKAAYAQGRALPGD